MPGGAITPSPPRLRTDLIVRRQDTPRGVYVVIKDPASGDFYRFGEVEDFILQQLDGTAPLEEIRRRAESRFAGALPDGALDLFVRKLNKNRLLEAGPHAPQRDPGRSRRPLRGNLLYLRFPLLDPTRLFDWLLPRVRFFFTRGFMAFSAAVIILAATTLAMSWSSFREDFTALGFPSDLPMLIVVLFALVSMHEFAHGMACRHFGGEVREMGFMLIYFAPAFYCNVSDAWLFQGRAKRMWVGFAGPYFELFLWALAVLAWRATEADTWISHVALLAMIGSGIKTLVNFNPLIKLDGYYLLSDFLEIPNLRRKSFRYVGDLIRRLVGSSDRPAPPASPRERRIYLAYGTLATVYSFSLLVLVTVKAGGILIGNGQPIALALLGGMVGTKLRNRIRGLMGKGMLDDDPSDAGSDPDAGAGSERATPRRSRGLRVKRRRLKIAGAAAVLVLGVVVVGRVELRVSGPVNVLPEENDDVRAPVAGLVENVAVDEGDRVKAGSLIARLSDQALLSDLHTTEADIREAQANLQKLVAGPTPAEIAVARATLAKTVDQAEYARAQLLRIGQAFQLQVVSRREFEDTQALTRAAVDDQVEAQRRLDVLCAGTRREEIEAARARIEGLESRRRHLSEQANRLNVVSPVAGVVATPSRELHAMERQFVPAGGLIAKVYEINTVVAQIMVSEKDIADLRPGQRVEVRTRALPGVPFRGVVTSIAVAADAGTSTGLPTTSSSVTHSAAARTFVVTSRIDNRTRLLLPGMTGHAKVSCGQLRTLDLIGRRLAQTLKVDVWSWW